MTTSQSVQSHNINYGHFKVAENAGNSSRIHAPRASRGCSPSSQALRQWGSRRYVDRKKIINGSLAGDKCFCKDGWTGALCHRKMNCEGYERKSDGSCEHCLEGWQGPDCDAIDCNDHGEPNYDQTICHCNKPYSGDYCEKFTTEDIYSYYNNLASRTGAGGVLTIIPLALIYFVCDRFAKRRQQQRVEDQLDGTHYRWDRVMEEEKQKQGLLAEQEDMTV